MRIFMTIPVFILLTVSATAQTLSVTDLGNSYSKVQEGFLPVDLPISKPASNVFPQQSSSAAEILDSIYGWAWYRANNEWIPTYKLIYVTDGNANNLSQHFLLWDGTQWNNQSFDTYQYDLNHNLLTETTQVWNGTDWENSRLTSYSYDSDNNQTQLLEQIWNGSGWDNSYRFDYTYDNNHNRLTQETAFWSGSDWIMGMRHTFTYDQDNHLLLRLVQSWYGEWTNVEQIIYTYNANGLLVETLDQKWVSDQWEDNYRNHFEYDVNQNLSRFVRQNLVGGTWVPEYQFIYDIDINDNILSLLYQTFMNDEWVNDYRFMDTYNSNQNRLTEVFQVWEDEWFNQDSSYYFYSEASDVHDVVSNGSIHIFPNPATDVLHVGYKGKLSGTYSLEIYSKMGVKVMRANIHLSDENLIDISHLLPGSYTAVIHDSNGISLQHFVKVVK